MSPRGIASEDDRRRPVADAHAVDAHVDEFEEVLARADAAGALHLDFAFAGLHHEFHDFVRGAHIGLAREEACGRLDEVRPRGNGAARTSRNLLRCERVGFEDHLHRRSVLVAHVDDGLDVGREFRETPAAEPSVVGDNVEFEDLPPGAIRLRLKHLRRGGGKSEREIAHHADLRFRSLAEFRRQIERSRIHAHRRTSEVDSFLDVLANLRLGKLRLENRLVDIGRKFAHRHVSSFFSRFHSSSLSLRVLYQNPAQPGKGASEFSPIEIGNPMVRHCGALGERVYRLVPRHLPRINTDGSARISHFTFDLCALGVLCVRHLPHAEDAENAEAVQPSGSVPIRILLTDEDCV